MDISAPFLHGCAGKVQAQARRNACGGGRLAIVQAFKGPQGRRAFVLPPAALIQPLWAKAGRSQVSDIPPAARAQGEDQRSGVRSQDV